MEARENTSRARTPRLSFISNERVLLGQAVVLVDIPVIDLVSEWSFFDLANNLLGFPRVADPHVVGRDRGVVTTSLHHIRGQRALLRLVLVLQKKRGQIR